MSILFCHWHINIDSKGIEYCPLSGKTKYCYFDRMTKVELDQRDNIFIYSENESVLKLPVEIASVLSCYVYVFFNNSGLGYFFSIKVNMLIGTLFWSVIFICLISKTISDFLEKIMYRIFIFIQKKV